MHGTIGQKSELIIFDITGHTKIEWDANVAAECSMARAAFEDATGRGYQAFKVTRDGGQGERVTAFDSAAEKYILAPQLRGG